MISSIQSQDYYRIEQAIAFLREHYQSQPSLHEVAACVGLSDSHMQRLFTRWAGVSPKRFVQFLSVEHAKRQISQIPDLFSLALDVGLSGSGRLHDLFLNMEALSPGEFKHQAAGLVIRWAKVPTPFGLALLAFSERGVCHLSFLEAAVDASARLRALWPQARIVEDASAGVAQASQIFTIAVPDKPVSAWVTGTNFQIQVWRALLQIPFGQVVSYQQVAQRLGKPRAARAVGTAIARNPIGYLIPCHRVLRQSGEIGTYHWGSDRKAAMVAWEAAQSSTFAE